MRNVLVFKVNRLTAAVSAILAFFAGSLLGLGVAAWITGIAPTDGIHLMGNGAFIALCALIPLLLGVRLMPEAEARRLTASQS